MSGRCLGSCMHRTLPDFNSRCVSGLGVMGEQFMEAWHALCPTCRGPQCSYMCVHWVHRPCCLPLPVHCMWMGTSRAASSTGRLMPVPHARGPSPPATTVRMRFRLCVCHVANAHPLPGTVYCERVCISYSLSIWPNRDCLARLPLSLYIVADEQHALMQRDKHIHRFPFTPAASIYVICTMS